MDIPRSPVNSRQRGSRAIFRLMALHWFNPPVFVKTDRPGVTYGVNHVEGAAEELMKWPKRGPKWKLALQSWIAGFEGRVSPQEVRMAFEAAAREEGMLRSSG
ncbi:DUF982 domain-containing protein [Mesorhizobium sp. M1334]|uniref:DUF982 domain-containing protein n=2 Tax=unclassified Mesorhizobium TaxID=325217 RepID=UPI00333B38E9